MKLAVILAFLFFGIDADIPSTDPCDNLKVTTEIKHTTDGLDNGSVEVKVEGGVGLLYYVYYYKDGKPYTRELHKDKLISLKAGTFYCNVVDSEGCTKKVEIIIK